MVYHRTVAAITLRVPDDLHGPMRIAAAHRGLSMSAWLLVLARVAALPATDSDEKLAGQIARAIDRRRLG
jgi:hypothetical protein